MKDKKAKLKKMESKLREENSDLKKFEILMNYLIYENTTFWNRSNFFLIAVTALLGFSVSQIPSFSLIDISKLIGIIIISIVGIFLCSFWHLALKSGEFWINHWHELIITYEKKCWKEELFSRYATRPGFDSEHDLKLGK